MYRPATGFTALYSSLNWLQCTGYTALNTGFNNWLQSVPTGTGYTALYTCFNLPVTSLQTGCWLVATQSLLYRASPQLVTKKKKKKYIYIYIETSSCLNSLVTPASQFFAGYRKLLVTVKYRVWSPGTGQSCLSKFGYREFLDQSVVLGIWQWYDSVPSYCQATFPYHTSQPVIGAGLDLRDNKFCHHVWPGVRHLTNDNCSVNAAPCRLLARGKESLLMWKVVSAPPDHNKNRETVNLDHCHQTGPVSGGTGNIVRIPNVPNVAHNLPVGSRLSPFWELRKPWGLDPR